jgi:DNA-binding XRE family transcriptional regulator
MSNSQEINSPLSDIYVCLRLKEERERKRLSQGQVAAELGVTGKTVWRWEKEIPIPSDKLNMLKNLGFDVVYVLTGERSLSSMIAADLTGVQYEIYGENGRAPRMPGDGVGEPVSEYEVRLKKLCKDFMDIDEPGRLVVEAMIAALLTKKNTEN